MKAPLRFLSFDLELFDTNAVEDIIEHQYERSDFKPTSPLHLGLKLENEWVHEMDVRAQPHFVRRIRFCSKHCSRSLIGFRRRPVLIRTPSWFLCEAACRHSNGDENSTDDGAREWLAEMYGEDEERVEPYLPSVLRPAICPDEIRIPSNPAGRRSRDLTLSERELLALQSRFRRGRFARVWHRAYRVTACLATLAGKAERCLATDTTHDRFTRVARWYLEQSEGS